MKIALLLLIAVAAMPACTMAKSWNYDDYYNQQDDTQQQSADQQSDNQPSDNQPSDNQPSDNQQSDNQQSSGGNNQDTSGDSCYITDEIKIEILLAHNQIRDMYASGKEGFPQAACMNELVWSDVDAKKAQSHADEGKFEHDTSQQRETVVGNKKIEMGQNIGFAEVGAHPNYTDTIYQMFTDEKGYLQPSFVQSFTFGSPYGHISEIIWGLTSAVGCGAKFVYKDKDVDPVRNMCLLVCNYSPPGNYDKKPMYIKGQSASDCMNGQSSDYSSLCSPPGYLTLDFDKMNQCPK